MWARLSAFVIWGAVGASAVFWLLRLTVDAPSAPPHTVPVALGSTSGGDWSRVLGAPPAASPAPAAGDEPDAEVPEASRFRLLGVVAPKAGRRAEGVALIAVDDGPPKAFRVGAVVDGTTVLHSVHGFGAALGPRGGEPAIELELPALPPPATGTLPPPGVAGGAAPPPMAAPGFPPPRPLPYSTNRPPPMPAAPAAVPMHEGSVDGVDHEPPDESQ